jgi:hypothetical protein
LQIHDGAGLRLVGGIDELAADGQFVRGFEHLLFFYDRAIANEIVFLGRDVDA